jgi:hypothetical protein
MFGHIYFVSLFLKEKYEQMKAREQKEDVRKCDTHACCNIVMITSSKLLPAFEENSVMYSHG